MDLRLGRARVVLAALALVGCSRAPSRPCAVLITLDTTRADALGCLGGPSGLTPNLDRLARECVVYEAAQSVAPITLPSHASMLTGLYPPRHTVRDNALSGLPPQARSLAEIAHEAGVATAAFVSAAVLDRAWGLAQGFDTYAQPGTNDLAAGSHIEEVRAADTVRAARAWLAARDRDRPFLLWVHLFDAHAPYRPDPRYLVQARGDAYRGEVAAMDDALGGLLADLRADPSWDRTMLVVVADHGESLGEHGEATHSVLCYASTIRVPFLVRHPRGRRAGERSSEIVSVVDVAPTLAEALGLPAPIGVDGISLATQRAPDDRGVYFESYAGYLNYGFSPLVGWFDREHRYLASRGEELYRRRDDPREANDVARDSPGETERSRAKVAEVAARAPIAPEGRTVGAGDADERIRALGYPAAGDPASRFPLPADAGLRPSPRERMGELATYYAAVDAANAGDEPRAIAMLAAITKANESNHAALDMLGALLSKAGRCEEALPLLEHMLQRSPGRVTTLTNLGWCSEVLGKLEQALQYYYRAEEVKPLAPEQIRNIARALEALGRNDEAKAWRERLPAEPSGARAGD